MADNKDLVIESGAGARGGAIAISADRGIMVFEKFSEIVDFSLYMSKSDKAVPSFLRGNPGSCMAIVIQANEWGFSPFACARMAYVVNDQIAYMAQLIHAVIEKRAPLKQRLRFDYDGEGAEMRVTVTGHFQGEVDPLIYVSPRIKDIKVKNSPLWTSDPGQQLSYYGSRAWSRRYCPEILLGVYDVDELPGAATQHVGADNAKDITPGSEEPLHHRLSAKAAAAAGFDPKAIANTIDEASGRAAPAAPVKETAAGREPAVDDAADIPATSPVASDAAVVGAAAEIRTLAAANIQETPAEDGAGQPVNPGAAGTGAEPEGTRVATASALASEQEPDDSAPPSRNENSQGDAPVAKVSAPDDAQAPEAAAGGATTSAAAEPKESKKKHSYKPPPLPKAWAEYKAYVKQALLGPGKDDAEMVRSWWNSDFEKSMRTRLRAQTVDGGDAIMEEARILVTARIEELKARP